MASCSAEGDGTVHTGQGVAIMPTATLNAAQTFSRVGELSGPVAGSTFPKDTKNVFAVTAYKGNSVPTKKDYGLAAYFHNEPVNSSSIEGKMVFNTPQYYPDKGKLYFYAYSPVRKEATPDIGYKRDNPTGPTVTFKITEEPTDILWAKYDEEGIAISSRDNAGKQKQPTLNFEHKLQQLQFKFTKDASLKENCQVKEICVTGNPSEEDNKLKNMATLNLMDGSMTYEGENTEYKLKDLSYDVKTVDDAEEIGKCLIIRPIQNIKLTITYETNSGDGTTSTRTFTKDVTLDGAQTDRGGMNYLLTINFPARLSKPSVAVSVKGWEYYRLNQQEIDENKER